MLVEDIKHKMATENQEQRDHEKNQYRAVNDGEETELL